MENTTQFDLDQAIREWRAGIAGSPAFAKDQLDEMEHHLRDSTEQLMLRQLSAEEAFWLAVRRLGSTEALDQEYRKVNTERVWLDRTIWGVAFYLLYVIFSSLAGIVASLGTALSAYLLPDSQYMWARIALGFGMLLLMPLIVCFGAHKRVAEKFYNWTKMRPVVASFALLIVIIGVAFVSTRIHVQLSTPLLMRQLNSEMARQHITGVTASVTSITPLAPSALSLLWVPVFGVLLYRSKKLSVNKQAAWS